jgi:tRNA A-37 threonylcarbamoyl transferase component Bud32
MPAGQLVSPMPAALSPPPTRWLSAGKLRWKIRGDIRLETISHVLDDPEGALLDRSLYFADYPLATIARVPPRSPGGVRLVLRRLNYGRFRHRLRDFFRPSRAQRAFAASLGFERAGVTTPRALAAAEVRSLRWPKRAYLITEEVTDAKTLCAVRREVCGIPRQLVHHLAKLIGRMHEAGFSHRDLKHSNVLIDPNLQPFLIDLDGVRRYSKLPAERAIKDLAVFSRELRARPRMLLWAGARFLKHYCRYRGMEDAFRPWALRILNLPC